MRKSSRSGKKSGAEVSASHVRLIFALVIIAVFLDVIDFSVVNVAVPSIRAQFHSSLADVQWVIGAYGITMAGFLLLSGRAGDIYGQKRLFISGVLLFVVSSLAAALAPSLIGLIVFRGIQGIGAAISSVTAFAIFMALFPEGRERNRALGVFIAVLSGGFAAGAVAGGALTTLFGWRSVLLINVPIGLFAATLIQRFMPSLPGRSDAKHLDLPGALAVTLGLMLLVYALTVASSDGISSLQTLVPLGLAVLMLASFVAIESRSHAPLMPLSFLRRGVVLKANVIAIIVASIVGGTGFLVTIYMQQALGYSPFYAGLGFLPPAMIFLVIGGWGTSWFTDHLGLRKTLLLSTALIVAGSAILTQLSPKWGYIGMLPGILIWALGAAMGFPAFNLAAIAGAKRGEEGLASGLINTSQRLGFPLGLAVFVAIASAVDPTISAVSNSASAIAGFDYAFLAAAILGMLAFAISMRIKMEGPLKKDLEGMGSEVAETGFL
ncbi:MAG: MFS transporter [Candidatus Micrarchaeota archaeon]|nr:MFS transporter [Candidatus Micrarchaeota archaeon]